MQSINLYCKRCGVELFMSNAQEEHGELFIPCPICAAKNILAPYVFDKLIIPNLWQITGWRD